MKRIFLFSIIALAACGDTDQQAGNSIPNRDSLNKAAITDSSNYTSIEWLDSINTNVGKITEGQVIEVSWRFRNSGDKPLRIVDVSAGCGCTVPEKPLEPIAPGDESVIKARFDSRSQGPRFNKTVTVTANTKGQINHYLSFHGEVN